jgi:transposase-like protein
MREEFRPIPREIQQRIVALYTGPEGLSLRKVADEVGVHFETVRRILKRRGVRVNPPHKNLHSQIGMCREVRWTRVKSNLANLIQAESIHVIPIIHRRQITGNA